MARPPRILLLQSRDEGDPMLAHEFYCFAERTGLPEEAFTTLNVAKDSFDTSAIEGYDCIMVGGSGDHSLVKGKMPWRQDFLDLLKAIVDQGTPTFGSCFGFQGIVLALGGSLRRMEGLGEVGSFSITLTEDGEQDGIFGDLPKTFIAQLGHNDEAAELPEACVHLASSALTQYQAIRVKGAPIVATQFHPELSHERNFERFVRYIENYKDPDETIEEAIERTKKDYVVSPESSGLLKRFLQIELNYDPS